MAASSSGTSDSLLLSYNSLVPRYNSLTPPSSSKAHSLYLALISLGEQLRDLVASVSSFDSSMCYERGS